MKQKFAISRPILVFYTVLESLSQDKTVDTHIDHFWRPRIFGLQYSEAETKKANRSGMLDLSDPKFGMWPYVWPLRLGLWGQSRIPTFQK